MNSDIKKLLLLPHLKVQNANALSSPFTIGFPAITAWLGAVHALQRKVNGGGLPQARFNSVAIISHQVDLQVHKGAGDYVNSIIGTGNPLDKDGKRSPFIEEARCHLDVSLIIEYNGIDKDDEDLLIKQVTHHLNASMKIAGGDILSAKVPTLCRIEDGNEVELKKLMRNFMPGYAIIERRELIMEAMAQGQDAMDALLDYLVVHNDCEQDVDGHVNWKSHRKVSGWIVPITTGFHGISPLGEAKNQRHPEFPHRFAESVVTLGEFRMPHRIHSLNQILWYYQADLNSNLYLCKQREELQPSISNGH